MKHNYSDFAVVAELVYVDSMQNLKDAGYRRPGLEALCEEAKIERRGHSALDDAKILRTFCTMKSEEMLQNPYGSTFIDIVSYMNAKLPIPVQRVYGLANRCASHAELEYILYGYARLHDCLFLLQRLQLERSFSINTTHTRAETLHECGGVREYPKFLYIHIYTIYIIYNIV